MRRSISLISTALLSFAIAACSSDSSSESSTNSTASAPAVQTPAPATTAESATTAPATTEAPTTTPATTNEPTTEAPTTVEVVEPVRILVTNDDGFDAPGIDAVVQYLLTLPNVEISVVAPATNQSGAGDKRTAGSDFVVNDVTTASGYAAKAVLGFPADSVLWALNGGLGFTPDLVISGSNSGQNYGPLVLISGTVGAAATAARNDVPAIAISQGFGTAPQEPYFPASVTVLSEYLTDSLASYVGGDGPLLVSINVPTCPDNELFETVVAPPALAENGRALGAPAICDGPLTTAPIDDIDAFNAGHAVISTLDPVSLGGTDGVS